MQLLGDGVGEDELAVACERDQKYYQIFVRKREGKTPIFKT
jgi:hypothetical protein